MVGSELCGALKNIYAIASGMLSGIGLGDNAKAGLISRALVEMRRFVLSFGASEETIYGLTGLGDLVVTTTSVHSRNFQAGYRLATGKNLEETISSLNKKFSASFEGVADSDETLTKVLTSTKYLVPYLNFVKENRRAYKVIHQNPDLFGARSVNNKMYEQVFSPALNNFGVKAEEKPYVLAFYTYGSLAVISEWLKNDCKEDVDFIADLISRNTRANELN